MSDPIEIMTRAMVANDNGPEGSALFSIHWREFESGYRDSAKAALAALHAAGLRIVPEEPTESMIAHGGAAVDHPSVFMGGPSRSGKVTAERTYRAMIAAAGGRDE